MRQRYLWTAQQDKILKYLKEVQKVKKWSQISRILQDQYKIINRTGKQCRERYYNHLDESIKKQDWTQKQEDILYQMHYNYGNKWTLMVNKLKGRSQNCIKNHFYSKLRKAARKINRIVNQKFKLQFKQIKTTFVYKIIQLAQDKFKPGKKFDLQLVQLATSIKNKLYLFQKQITDIQKTKQHQITRRLLIDIRTIQQSLYTKNFNLKDIHLNFQKQQKQGFNDIFLHPKSCASFSNRSMSMQSDDNLSSSFNSCSNFDQDQSLKQQIQNKQKHPLKIKTTNTHSQYKLSSNLNNKLQDFQIQKSPLVHNNIFFANSNQSLGSNILKKSLQLTQSKSQTSLFNDFTDLRVSQIYQQKQQFAIRKCWSYRINEPQQNQQIDCNQFKEEQCLIQIISNQYNNNIGKSFFQQPQLPQNQGFQFRILSPKKSQESFQSNKMDEQY